MAHSSLRIMNVVGARPNMMKMAPLMAEMARHPDIESILVHTGQHYDYTMSQVFFEQLRLPVPDYNLEAGSAAQHVQMAEIMRRFGDLVQSNRPHLVLVVGDVNSTLACALVAAQQGIPVAHVEAGLRSFDRTMPEEINRILTDAVSELLFTTEESGNANLTSEGVAAQKIHLVGNLMIDCLAGALGAVRQSQLRAELGLAPRTYAVLTLHRPSNVDDPKKLKATLDAVRALAERLPVLFPVHPRTRSRIAEAGIQGLRTWAGGPIVERAVWMMDPASYLDFLGIVDTAALVMTDSGGIQEETTWLGVPCLTYRNNTERPATVTMGSNQVVGADPQQLLRAACATVENRDARDSTATPRRPPLWDGAAAPRIVRILRETWQLHVQPRETSAGVP